MSRSSRASCWRTRAVTGRYRPRAPALDQLAEVGDLGPAVGDGVGREAVAEILEREAAARGELAGGEERLREVGEPPGHLGGSAEVALGVRREPPAQRVERGPEPDGRQDVEDRALAGRRVADAAGGDDGEPGLPRERHGAAGPELALARAVPLELHVDPVPAEALDEPIERGPRPVPAPGEAVGGERPVLAPGEADEALDRALEVVQRRPRPALRRPGLHAGDEAPERPVPGAGLDEERQARAVGEREGGADEGAHARRLRRLVEARRAVDAVHVDEGERGAARAAPPPRPGPRAPTRPRGS